MEPISSPIAEPSQQQTDAGAQEKSGEEFPAFERLARAITPRVAYSAMAILLLGFVVLAVQTYASVKRELTEAVMARRVAVAQLAAQTLSERLDRIVDLGVSLATRVRFAELVSAGQWRAAVQILQAVPGEFRFVDRVVLADLRGTVMADVPELNVRGENFAHFDWYRGVSRAWKPYVSALYRREAAPESPVFAVAVPILDRGRAPTGILQLQVDLEAFSDWARAIDLGAGGSLYVVDGKGAAAFHSANRAQSKILDLSAHPAVARLLQGKSGAEVLSDPADGVEYVYAFMPGRHGWNVVVEQPASRAFAARANQLRRLLVGYAVILAFCAAVAALTMHLVAQQRRARDDRRLLAELERRMVELQRTRQALAKHADRLRILHEIDRALVADEPAEAIAAAVIPSLRELLGVPRAIVNRFDIPAGQVEWIAAAGRRRTRVGPGVRYSIRLMGDLEALRRGAPQLIDVHELPPGPEVDALLASGVDEYMVVPMIAGGELIGALSFGGPPGPFPREQVEIAREVATQLAIAIAQARLHEQVRGHAQQLEQRVAERTAELDSANRELEDLYERAPCGYHSVDEDARIVRINDTWLSWLGYTREEVVGKMRHPDLMTPESAERFWNESFPLFKKQGWLKEVEFEYVRKDGTTFPGSLQTSTVYGPDGRYVMSRTTVFDVSERKAAEERIHALNDELQTRAAQLEAANKELESFSYSVSHDLRAPLRAVDGYARMLEEDYAPRLDDEGRRLLGVVRDASRRMGELIDDLLAFSRLGRQELAKQPLDMTALVREVLAKLTRETRADVELAPLPSADADRALLRQVWVNLIGNALKYSGTREAARIEIGGRQAPGENVYWVRDNGVGFDMRYAGKLFGVFQRLHAADEFPGTGVGLAIVQRVVSRHGGRVWGEGRPGKGATFHFSLPKEG